MFRRWGLAWVFLAACGQRDRLTFPAETPGNDGGPFTIITQPVAGDTLVSPGDPFIVSGFTRDPDGVDSVFFDLTGAGFSYPPLDANGADSVQFAIQLPTLDLSGDTLSVVIFAVDKQGERGNTAARQIRIR